jgi:DNA-binding transcriptional LysR family regulator
VSGTIRLDDMRLFARVAALGSFTRAAQQLGMPKQTLSRRVSDLERALGVRLMHRTTRLLRLSEAGAVYARRCAELVRLADDANRAVTDDDETPRGTLRVTADRVFGEAFVTDLLVEYARRWPEVRIDVTLTRRRVDLIEEGYDVAFRVGHVDDPALSGVRLGPARVRYCASPDYVARHGEPASPQDLARHACVVVTEGDAPVRWPFRGRSKRASALVSVRGQLRVDSFAMAHAAVLAGLGIAIFPEFACESDLRAGTLVDVLDAWRVDVGTVWLLHAARPFVTSRVRAFVELACARFAASGPWRVEAEERTRSGRPRPGRRRRS